MAARHLDRRAFLSASGTAFAAALLPARAEALVRTDAVFASAYVDRSGGYGAALLTESGDIVAEIPLPSRGHDITCHSPSRRAVVFARRPGTIAVTFDADGKSAPGTIVATAGRHFYGHGVFSRDGSRLYASENDFENAAGVVGIYDADDGYRRIGEISSGGIGPHDMLLLGDGRTLVIANGGLETHPDFGRTKLNLATMQPSLCFIDRRDGTLIERLSLPATLHRLSIRHLAGDGAGGVYFACQYEGAGHRRPPLCGHAKPGRELRLFDLPEDHLMGLKNYIGSIAANNDAGTVAVTSPRGNSLLVLDGATGNVLSHRRIANVCGISDNGSGYLASTGNGLLANGRQRIPGSDTHLWDNHLVRIAG
ncbi:DUF1513 domain-containing protein [Hoeflea poritis]|uniref:DUF1513 domain-containing protein n=1 Tax=Hoeflea poritis TaxID=2993659 RepID=A0ABT4VPE0_9HYPH|nr:DUF1513 domain-containing protein [Hoeflea poritis]MDA4846575.1 DUF1513 domain-containing protein [Hoeflea poritis]